MQRFQHFINNEWAKPNSGEYLDNIDPYTQKAWSRLARGNQVDAVHAVEAADAAFSVWATLHPTERAGLMCKLAELIREHADEIAEVEVRDNGKLLTEVRAQMDALAKNYEYFAGLADKIEGRVVPIDKPDSFVSTRRVPLGVIVAISPWNSPLMTTAWKVAPALAAGNTVVVKPSEHASVSNLKFAELIRKAGFPSGVFNVVTGLGDEIGAALVSHPRVAKVAFTGGAAGASHVYSAVAKQLKPVVLELGGKSPNIVFADANLDNAANGVIAGIFAANGQTCIAGSRLLVARSVHDQLVSKIIDTMRSVKQGNPMLPDTQMGPMANEAQYDKVLEYFEIAQQDGATCVLGGKPSELGGWFVEPTIFTNVNNNMRIACEEVFGPILAVIPFDTEAEALAIANDTPYGLAAGVWTSDMAKAMRMSENLQAGTVWINTYRAISVYAPFGGFKASGIGRENGQESIDAYLQSKTVWLSTQANVANPFVIKV